MSIVVASFTLFAACAETDEPAAASSKDPSAVVVPAAYAVSCDAQTCDSRTSFCVIAKVADKVVEASCVKRPADAAAGCEFGHALYVRAHLPEACRGSLDLQWESSCVAVNGNAHAKVTCSL